MKILLIHPFFLPPDEAGGGRWNEMSRFWTQQGHQLTVIAGMVNYANGWKYSHCRGKWVVEETTIPNLRVVRTHVSERYNAGWSGRLWAYLTLLLSCSWATLFRLGGTVDVVIVSSPPLLIGLLGVVVARWRKVPLITEVRDLWPDAPVQMAVLRNRLLIRLCYRFEQWLYRQSTRVVVLTPGFHQVLTENKGVPSPKITTIPNAADFQLTDPILSDFDREAFRNRHALDDGFWVAYVGAHGAANRLEWILRAAQLLRNEPINFLMVGDGMEKERLKKQAADAHLNNIRFLGLLPRPEAFRFILACDAGLVSMQRLEIFKTMYANKIFDYMAARKPVLLALDGIARTLVETAGSGLYVEPENPEDLVEKIRCYQADRELLQEHGDKGYAFAKRNYNRLHWAQQYLNLIKGICIKE